jgi:hypothetical protein
MQVTKIAFSDEEMEAVLNSRFFLVKHDVMKKVMDIFAQLESELKKEIVFQDIQYDNLQKETGKIFRGENYKNLPYMVLDYPKLFSADNVLTFRTMFWWGREFSFTLHLQGRALERFYPKIESNISQLLKKDFYFCINQSPWQYSFTEDNYLLLDDLYHKKDFHSTVASREFIKMSRKLPIAEYGRTIEYGTETFKLVMGLLE